MRDHVSVLRTSQFLTLSKFCKITAIYRSIFLSGGQLCCENFNNKTSTVYMSFLVVMDFKYKHIPRLFNNVSSLVGTSEMQLEKQVIL